MRETVSTVIVKSCSLYHLKLSFLRQWLNIPAVTYCHKELHLTCWRRPGSTSDYSIWQSNYSLGASKSKCHIVLFNCYLWGIWRQLPMLIVKSCFTRGSRVQIACQRLSRIELSATKVDGFLCKAVPAKSSILDIADVPDPSLITIFGKVTFNLTQATVILFNLIQFMEEAICMVIIK